MSIINFFNSKYEIDSKSKKNLELFLIKNKKDIYLNSEKILYYLKEINTYVGLSKTDYLENENIICSELAFSEISLFGDNILKKSKIPYYFDNFAIAWFLY